jgi:flagellar motor switch protein FliN/FliY
MDTTDDNKLDKPQNGQDITPETVQQEAPTLHSEEKGKLDFLFDVPLKISVEIGRALLVVKDLLKMQEGYVIELDKAAGEPLDLYVNSRLIARGEAVLVNDRFGIRLTEVVSPSERLEKLG